MRVKIVMAVDDKGLPVRTMLELAEGATVGDAARALVAERGPGLGRLLWGDDGAWRVAVFVNRRDVAPDAVLRDGDELALLPPITGG